MNWDFVKKEMIEELWSSSNFVHEVSERMSECPLMLGVC